MLDRLHLWNHIAYTHKIIFRNINVLGPLYVKATTALYGDASGAWGLSLTDQYKELDISLIWASTLEILIILDAASKLKWKVTVNLQMHNSKLGHFLLKISLKNQHSKTVCAIMLHFWQPFHFVSNIQKNILKLLDWYRSNDSVKGSLAS